MPTRQLLAIERRHLFLGTQLQKLIGLISDRHEVYRSDIEAEMDRLVQLHNALLQRVPPAV